MSVINATPLLAAAGGEYEISRSVRLRVTASGNFSRTTASAGNLNKWTYSFWTKKAFLDGTTGATSVIGCTADANNFFYLRFSNGTSFNSRMRISGTDYETNWTPLYRDPSAWYHFVYVYDRQNATTADRQILYVNGVRQATSSTSNPSTDSTSWNTSGRLHYIGHAPSNSDYYDGYLAEINFIDGQALTPSSFGETDSITGVWKPKKYAGTYGTNGFYLNFSDNSSNTATTIGKDNSGNGNNWTPNNISVTAGSTYDSMIDSPTMYADGGNGRGNYCVLNPLITASAGVGVLSNGNLQCVTPTSAFSNNYGTIGVSSGKWYWEIIPSSLSATNNIVMIGIGNNTIASTEFYSQASGYAYRGNGEKWNNGAGVSYGSALSVNDVIGVVFDADNRTLEFYRNGTSMGVAYTGIPAGEFFPALCDTGTTVTWTAIANFGQRPFAYTPPTGFKALNTQNLPDATIKKGNAYFDVVARAGATAPTSVTSLAFQPDLLWTKTRSAVTNHNLFDSVRGLSVRLQSDNTGADAAAGSMVTSFNSNGYTFGSDYSGTNLSGSTHVDWVWKESVSAGFDIVTYTGTGSARTVSHSLGVAPAMMIVKNRGGGGVDGWVTYHQSIGNTGGLLLNSTSATTTTPLFWNNTSPTSSVFSVSTSTGVNANTNTYVAYLFSEVAGYSKFGIYTGNGSTDGPFVYLGFRPRYVLIKKSSAAGDSWFVFDTSRETSNEVDLWLAPNLSNAETSNSFCDILSNGFKIRGSISAFNASGETYIYAAFAENPFKNSLAR